ncbi:MAG TPA: hypothetical protein VG055_23880 [Planctomycetaceae bacterium]|jgi:hypothetical protein|nr:hypothetical protein [Planctomycetaceae bacterium]
MSDEPQKRSREWIWWTLIAVSAVSVIGTGIFVWFVWAFMPTDYQPHSPFLRPTPLNSRANP